MLRFLTAGESHGPSLTAILEGVPAGLSLDRQQMDRTMARRRAGFGSSGRTKIEPDVVELTAGVIGGRTTGAPIAIVVENRDHASWTDRSVEPMTVPRPGHADLTAAIKYGYRDLRLGLERASARETAARVAVGALCMQLLQTLGVRVGSYVTSIGEVTASLEGVALSERFDRAERSPVRCPHEEASREMMGAIRAAARSRDTLGGVFEVVALGLPPGLGSHVHWDRRLGGRLLGAVGSIPAVKGVEIGCAFRDAQRRGTEVHDRLETRGQAIVRPTNHAGGLEGGITNGEPLVVRAAMKPIPTTLMPLGSVDLATGNPSATRYERSDICAVPRAGVVAEAMVAFVIADALLEKLGGDHLDELVVRFEALRRARLSDLPMDNVPLRLGDGGT